MFTHFSRPVCPLDNYHVRFRRVPLDILAKRIQESVNLTLGQRCKSARSKPHVRLSIQIIRTDTAMQMTMVPLEEYNLEGVGS